MTEDRGADTAGPALGAATAVDFPDGAGLGLTTAPNLLPSEPIASVSDGRPVRSLSEPITFVSDDHPLFTAGTSHQGVAPTFAPGEPIASVSDGRPARALSEPITSVSDGRPLSSAGTSHQGAAPALALGEPVASVSDGRPARALSEPITSVSDGRPLFTVGTSHRGATMAIRPLLPTPIEELVLTAARPPTSRLCLHPQPMTPQCRHHPLAAPPSPAEAVSTADGATATAASAVDTGMDVDTVPSPARVAPPTAEHVSSFLLHIRRRATDEAASSSPDATEGTVDGATATATARKHKRNRRGSGLHTAKDRCKMGDRNAAYGIPAVAADGTGRPDMAHEPGGGV